MKNLMRLALMATLPALSACNDGGGGTWVCQVDRNDNNAPMSRFALEIQPARYDMDEHVTLDLQGRRLSGSNGPTFGNTKGLNVSFGGVSPTWVYDLRGKVSPIWVYDLRLEVTAPDTSQQPVERRFWGCGRLAGDSADEPPPFPCASIAGSCVRQK